MYMASDQAECQGPGPLLFNAFFLKEEKPMPAVTLFPPANWFGVALDNDYMYLQQSPEDHFLEDNMVCSRNPLDNVCLL